MPMQDLIPDPEDPTKWIVGSAVLSNVHLPEKCAGSACVVHNPSNHHMRDWPLNWRDDRGMMERICPHGVGHPDPDSQRSDGVHGCCNDGCCRGR